MKRCIAAILFAFIIQLSFAQNLDKLKDSLTVSTKWKIVEYKKGITDTVGFTHRMPEPLLEMMFSYDTIHAIQCL
ncbi:MAG TPA: hypothetical protein VK796_10420 [Cytophaga sp.]|nr:hypothetical protein [Cytophaga sp.]